MNLIAIVDQRWGIGYRGSLLNNSPKDMQYFKEKTLHKVVVMGRKTLETLPNHQPLFDRINIVLSCETDEFKEGFLVCSNLESLLHTLSYYKSEDIFIIGGQSVYELLLPFCDTAFITKMDCHFTADRYLSNFDLLPNWNLISTQPFFDVGLPYSFNIYKKSFDCFI